MNKLNWPLMFLALSVLFIGLYYRHESREVAIRMACGVETRDFANRNPQPPADAIDVYLKICFAKNGLSK